MKVVLFQHSHLGLAEIAPSRYHVNHCQQNYAGVQICDPTGPEESSQSHVSGKKLKVVQPEPTTSERRGVWPVPYPFAILIAAINAV